MPRTTVLAAMVCAGSLALSAAATAAAKTYVTSGDYPEKTVPTKFTAGSGVGGGVMGLSHMRWVRWGKASAVGRGKLTYNTCEPMCASGNTKTVSATVKLSRPKAHCPLGFGDDATVSPVPVFTHITISSWGSKPWKSITSDTQSCQQ
jgi:hypothetical protein